MQTKYYAAFEQNSLHVAEIQDLKTEVEASHERLKMATEDDEAHLLWFRSNFDTLSFRDGLQSNVPEQDDSTLPNNDDSCQTPLAPLFGNGENPPNVEEIMQTTFKWLCDPSANYATAITSLDVVHVSK